jgi:hypothetical protein
MELVIGVEVDEGRLPSDRSSVILGLRVRGRWCVSYMKKMLVSACRSGALCDLGPQPWVDCTSDHDMSLVDL